MWEQEQQIQKVPVEPKVLMVNTRGKVVAIESPSVAKCLHRGFIYPPPGVKPGQYLPQYDNERPVPADNRPKPQPEKVAGERLTGDADKANSGGSPGTGEVSQGVRVHPKRRVPPSRGDRGRFVSNSKAVRRTGHKTGGRPGTKTTPQLGQVSGPPPVQRVGLPEGQGDQPKLVAELGR